MRSSLLAAVTAAAGIAYATDASAVAWTPPASVRIVQKDSVASGTRVYTSILTAVASCDGVTPCLVKVMPGTYDLGTGSLRLKPFVTVEGSGPESTVITSANTANTEECDNGVVMMANDSVLRQVKVVNKVLDSTAGASHAHAVVFRNVAARAEFMHAVSAFPANGIENGSWSRRIGVCVDGDPASGGPARADLVHVYAEGNNRSGQGNGVRVRSAATANVTDSHLVGVSTTDSAYPINSTGEGGTIAVNDSLLESKGGETGDACPLWGGQHFITVTNSRLSLTSYGAYPSAVYSQVFLKMMNTTITANTAPNYEVGGTVTIANSQLPGDRTNLVNLGAKLVGNYDESFSAIPNQ
jgi:hypothetical protein